MRTSIIVAVDSNNGIGKSATNSLAWHLSADLKRFKALTTGHAIVMGRKTYQSIGRPLPQRTNIVVSTNPDFQAEGCTVVPSLSKALEVAAEAESKNSGEEEQEIFVIGGGQIYAEALPYTQRLYVTKVSGDFGCNVFFPDYSSAFTKLISTESGSENGLGFEWKILER